MRVKLYLNSLLPTGERLAYETVGELFERAGAVYLRYAEDEAMMGQTMTTLKWKKGSLRLVRHGQIEMSQQFLEGQTTTGWYRSPFASFPLRQITDRLRVAKGKNGYRVEIDYRLSIGDEILKPYRIWLRLEEVSGK